MSVDGAMAWQSPAVCVDARVSHIISRKGFMSAQGMHRQGRESLTLFFEFILRADKYLSLVT